MNTDHMKINFTSQTCIEFILFPINHLWISYTVTNWCVYLNHNSRNISEGKKVLKSHQNLAIGCTKETGNRKNSQIIWNTMECERDSFSDLGGMKETHWEHISHARKIVLFCKRVTLFPHTITGNLTLIIIIMNKKYS